MLSEPDSKGLGSPSYTIYPRETDRDHSQMPMGGATSWSTYSNLSALTRAILHDSRYLKDEQFKKSTVEFTL